MTRSWCWKTLCATWKWESRVLKPRSKADGGGLEDADASAESFDRKVALIREAAAG